MKNIYLRDYIDKHSKLNFCDVELFEFGKPDESIGVCRTKIGCHKHLEEFILQCFLVLMGGNLFAKKEILDINIGKLHNLNEFLFKMDWRIEYELIPMDTEALKTLLHKWLDEQALISMDLKTDNINSSIMLGAFDSMTQQIIFDTNHYKYLLVRNLG
jgi:hypothetical protein